MSSQRVGDVITLRKVLVPVVPDEDAHIPIPTGDEEIVAVIKGAGHWVGVILARYRRSIPVNEYGRPA